MPLETFTPALEPTYQTSTGEKPRVLRAEFGDGYSQRTIDGLNSLKVEGTLNFDGLTVEQADDIIDFCRARNGSEAFYFTLPREDDPRKFICTDWKRVYQAPLHDGVIMTIEEVFDI
jgi:phage-related protein